MNTVLIIALAITAISYQVHGHNGARHEDVKRKFQEHKKQCMEEFDIPLETPIKNIPDDKKCFFQCMLQKHDLMNADGEVTFESFKEKHENMPEKAINHYRNCIDKSEETETCDKAQEIFKCIKKHCKKGHGKHMKIVKECMEEYDVSKDELKSDSPLPENKKCFYKCLAVKSGKMNEDGEITVEEFKERNPDAPEKKVKNLEECADSIDVGEDPCFTAKLLMECTREKRHHHTRPYDM